MPDDFPPILGEQGLERLGHLTFDHYCDKHNTLWCKAGSVFIKTKADGTEIQIKKKSDVRDAEEHIYVQVPAPPKEPQKQKAKARRGGDDGGDDNGGEEEEADAEGSYFIPPEFKKESFIDMWFKSNRLPVYSEGVGMYPNKNRCPPDIFNLWTPYRCQLLDKKGPYTPHREGLTFWLTCWYKLVEREWA